jgi:hypothetical protein
MVSRIKAGGSSAMAPTISCRPTTIRRLPPSELALFTVSVATVSATTPSTHMTIPTASAPPLNLSAMMIATPAKPATSPSTPITGSSVAEDAPVRRRHQERHHRRDDRRQRRLNRLHRNEIQPQIQRVLADAEDQTARHCARDRPKDCPSASAMPIPRSPDRKNRSDSAVSGGAASTMIRADVKAEDQTRAKTSPRSSARTIHSCPKTRKGRALRPGATLSRLSGDGNQPLTLSFSALAMVTLTCLSASFLICSPVAGLRTMRSGRSRQ